VVKVPTGLKNGKFGGVYAHTNGQSTIHFPLMVTEEWGLNSSRAKVEGYINFWLPVLSRELALIEDDDVEAMEHEEKSSSSSDDSTEKSGEEDESTAVPSSDDD